MQVLRQPEYVHVLINHVPLTGLFAAWLVLIAGLIFRQRAVLLLGLGLVSLFALAVWPVYEYGEDGYDRVYSMADNDGDAYLQHHRELAERWVWTYYLTAAVGAVGLLAAWKRPGWQWAAAAATGALAVASLAAGVVIAEAGGKVRHREFRHGPPPAMHETGTAWSEERFACERWEWGWSVVPPPSVRLSGVFGQRGARA